jgi:hypothetical protein
MHLGVPFIAPRQLGAVESIPGRQFLPSVAWRTGQSGAPPDTVQCGLLSFFGEADRWRFRAVSSPDTVRCTPDSPVPPSDRWLCHASRADYATDRWPSRLLAHRTVPCTPDSPVHHRTLSSADLFPYLAKPTVADSKPLTHQTLSGAHRTVRCPLVTVGSATCHARNPRLIVGPADRWLTGQSGAPPDSPVIYSRTPLITSRERRLRL